MREGWRRGRVGGGGAGGGGVRDVGGGGARVVTVVARAALISGVLYLEGVLPIGSVKMWVVAMVLWRRGYCPATGKASSALIRTEPGCFVDRVQASVC